jgi:hypothetical protein
MRTKNLGERYSLPSVEWSTITERLDKGLAVAPGSGGPDHLTCWLATINVDGSPHVNALGALWVDGTYWFVTGETTRRGRNLARDSRCAMSVATDEFELVTEGRAERVTDRATVAQMAKRWADQGWPCKVDDSGLALTAPYSAPSAGGPPWSIYRMTITSAHALTFGGESGGAMRWEFDQD